MDNAGCGETYSKSGTKVALTADPPQAEAFHTEGHLFPKQGAGELLAAFPPESSRSIVHLLDCPHCQDIALAELADVLESRGERRPEDPGSEETRALLAELLAVPEGNRAEALKDGRFHRIELLDLLLETGRTAQTRDAVRAKDLAALAIWLGSLVQPDGPGLRPRMLRAFCLDGSAFRLQGKLDLADKALDGASFFLTGEPEDVGLYSRSLALLRWEQGRWHDAAALLRHGAEAYGEILWRREQGGCLALLGLVYLEAGEIRKAPWPLLRGLRSLKERRPSRLSACCSLSLALSIALLGSKKEAQQAREQAWQLHVLPETSEQAEISWLEGRLAVALGEAEEAARLLDAARVHFLADRYIADAALASLDLAVLYAETGRGYEIGRLATELEEAGGKRPETSVGVDTLRDYARARPAHGRAPEKAAVLSAYLRRTLRVRFPGLQTLRWT